MGHRMRRQAPIQPILADEVVDGIWKDALGVLAECGVDMLDEVARTTFAREGAKIDGARVRLDPEMVRETISRAPRSFDVVARNPAHSVTIGTDEIVAAPIYGATHIVDANGVRRRGTLSDLHALHDLSQASPYLTNVGSNIIEPSDVLPQLRHLHTMRSLLTRTDKTFMPITTSRDPEVSRLNFAAVRGRDSLAMAACVFDGDLAEAARVVGVASCLEALTWSGVALQAIRLFAEAGQAVMLAPFTVVGRNAPPEPSAVITQITAEIVAGAVYAQLVRPSTPVLFGPHFVILGNEHARISAGADAELLVLASGQLARKAGLPFRAVGGLTGAKICDTQAAVEASAMLNASVAAGAHFLFHAAGWLDDGLSVSVRKFAIDSFMLEEAGKRQRALGSIAQSAAKAQLCGWGPGFDHSRNSNTAEVLARNFRPSPVADFRSWDAWQADGARTADEVASAAIQKLVPAPVPLRSEQIAALDDFIERRTAEISAGL